MKIDTFTKMGLLAVSAIFIVTAIGYIFKLPYTYIAQLTAIGLIAPSLGEGIEKATKRFVMIIAGCLAGWGLFLIVGHAHIVLFAFMLIFIFGMAYFQPVSYAINVFFIGLIIVAMFVELNIWSTHLFEIRVYQTIIACVTVIGVMSIFKPKLAGQTLFINLKMIMSDLPNLLDKIYLALGSDPSHNPKTMVDHITQSSDQISQLYTQFNQTQYETMFSGKNRQKLKGLIIQSEKVFHYLTAQATTIPRLTPDIRRHFAAHIKAYFHHLQQHLKLLTQPSDDPTHVTPLSQSTLRDEFRQYFLTTAKKDLFKPKDMMVMVSLAYYCYRFDDEVLTLNTMLKGSS